MSSQGIPGKDAAVRVRLFTNQVDDPGIVYENTDAGAEAGLLREWAAEMRREYLIRVHRNVEYELGILREKR